MACASPGFAQLIAGTGEIRRVGCTVLGFQQFKVGFISYVSLFATELVSERSESSYFFLFYYTGVKISQKSKKSETNSKKLKSLEISIVL
jgi:hypothetical protein